ncbi:putative alkaline phosphatase 3 [Bacteriovorax sp. BAL6_X]|nr:putative alkaline phosphatase 3 [Bacteriovorax sp. BAL6_X]
MVFIKISSFYFQSLNKCYSFGMKKLFKKFSLVSLVIFSSFAQTPKNIIIMIGDGMGPAYTTAYRNYVDRETLFDKLIVGSSITKASDSFITDSAAGATAYSTGEKSYNGAISVDTNKKNLKVLFEYAKDKGMQTGVVVTSEVYHATPACFYATALSRNDHEDIVKDLVFNQSFKRPIVDLIAGGGREVITKKYVNKLKGYHYLETLADFEKNNKLPVIALFDEGQMDFEINTDDKRLTKMTGKSLQLMNQNAKDGFILMIEASHIDKCGHLNDIACAMREMADFEGSLKLVHEFVKKSKNTLMVVTADHSTGGLSIGHGKSKKWLPENFRKIDTLLKDIAEDVFKKKLTRKLFKSYSIDFDSDDIKYLEKAQVEGEKEFYKSFARRVSAKSYTGWTTWSHNGVDVEVFADGPAKELFIGKKQNNEIGRILIDLLKKPLK